MKTQEQTGKKDRVTICLETDQVKMLKKVCVAVDCSMSWLISQLVDKADLNALIKGYEHGNTEEAKL